MSILISILSTLVLFFTVSAQAHKAVGRTLEKTEVLFLIDNKFVVMPRTLGMKILTYSVGTKMNEEVVVSFSLCDLQTCESIGQEMNLKTLSFVRNFRQKENLKKWIGGGVGAGVGLASVVGCALLERCLQLIDQMTKRWTFWQARLLFPGVMTAGIAVGAGIGSAFESEDSTDFQNFMIDYKSYLEDSSDRGLLKVKNLDDFVEQISAYQIENMTVNQ